MSSTMNSAGIALWVITGVAMAVLLGGCGLLWPAYPPPPPEPAYPVYIEQQQPIVVPSTTTVSPTPTVVTPNY